MGLWNNYLTTLLPRAVKFLGPSPRPQTGSVHQAPFPMALLPLSPPPRETGQTGSFAPGGPPSLSNQSGEHEN